MPENHTQTEPYFQIRRDFANKRKMRRVRELGVDYLTAGTWRVGMLDMATNARVFGEFTVDVRNFVRALGGVPSCTPEEDAQLAETWRRFELAKLVAIIDGDPAALDEVNLPAEFRAKVLDMEGNTPRAKAMTPAEKQRAYRARKAEETPPDALPSVTGVTTALPSVTSEVTRYNVTGNQQNRTSPTEPAEQNHKVSKGLGDAGEDASGPTSRLTLDSKIKITDAVEYEIERLLPKLIDADDETENVLRWLASIGAGEADFADARAALDACHPLRPAAYAVTTIQNRLQGGKAVGA